MGSIRAASPPSKRIKLEASPSPSIRERSPAPSDVESSEPEEHCSICLQSLVDRTIIPTCAHEFCFECILLWSEQSRKCPLCSRSFENSYLIHHIRSQYDYQKHYLPPRSSPQLLPTGESRARALRNTRRERQWGRRERRRRDEADQLERAIARRRWIYRHHLYAKHVASNSFTRYRPFPSPAQFTASPDLISRMTAFLRRELRVWTDLDVEFLTTFTISLMKSIDIRSESAVKLLADFLDLDAPYVEGGRHVNAEHFAHEIYCYLRSPYRDLKVYDQVVQYDTPPDLSPPHEPERGSRWIEESPERLPSPRSPRRSRSRSYPRPRSPVPYVDSRTINLSSGGRRKGTSVEERPSTHGQHRHGRDTSRDSPEPEYKGGRRAGDRSRSAHHLSRDAWAWEQREQEVRRIAEPRVEDQREQHTSDRTAPPSPRVASSRVRLEDPGNVSPPRLAAPREDVRGKGKGKEEPRQGDTPKLSTPPGVGMVAAMPLQEVAAAVERSLTPGEVPDRNENIQDGIAPGSHSDNIAGATRVPRHRTLLESVQAHLARPAAPRRVTEPAQELEGGEGESSKGSHTRPSHHTAPTLLARLSSASGSLQHDPESLVEENPAVSSDNEEIDTLRKMSQPLLLGHTSSERGKMKDVQNSHSTRPLTSHSADRGRPSHPNLMPPGPISTPRSSHSMQTTAPPSSSSSSSSIGAAMFSSDIRTVLLEKLKEEQKQGSDDNDNNSNSAPSPRLLGVTSSSRGPSCPTPDLTDNGSQVPSSIKDNNDNNNLNNEHASFDLEAKLRARALLRVRLTAIKGTSTGTSPLPPQNDNKNDGTGKDGCNRSNESATSSGREQALREKLRERLII